MQRNILELYLTKVASGDKGYIERLCQRLAERLLWVPIGMVEELSRQGEPVQRCELITIKADPSPLIPVFTLEQKAKEWIQRNGMQPSMISMPGRELCLQLDKDLGLLVNDMAKNCVELPPGCVAFIAATSPAEPEPEPEAPPPRRAPTPKAKPPPAKTQPARSVLEQATAEVMGEKAYAESQRSGKTIEIVVDLKKVQELVRQKMEAEQEESPDEEDEEIPVEQRVITLYEVISEDKE